MGLVHIVVDIVSAGILPGLESPDQREPALIPSGSQHTLLVIVLSILSVLISGGREGGGREGGREGGKVTPALSHPRL